MCPQHFLGPVGGDRQSLGQGVVGQVLFCCWEGQAVWPLSSSVASERVFVPWDPCPSWIPRSFWGHAPPRFPTGAYPAPHCVLPIQLEALGGLGKGQLA